MPATTGPGSSVTDLVALTVSERIVVEGPMRALADNRCRHGRRVLARAGPCWPVRLPREQQLHREDDHRRGHHDPDPGVPLEHGQPHAEQAPQQGTDRQDQARRPVDVAAAGEDGQRDHGEGEDAQHLDRVAPHEVQPGQGGGRQHQKAHPRLDEPAVGAHQQKADPQCQTVRSCPRRLAVRSPPGGAVLPPPEWVPEGPEGQRDHQRGQDLLEGLVAHPQRGPAAHHRAHRGGERAPEDPAPVQHAVPVEAPDRAEVLQQDPHPVGAVGQRRGQTEEDQHGQGEEGAPSGDDVDRPGGAAHAEEHEV